MARCLIKYLLKQKNDCTHILWAKCRFFYDKLGGTYAYSYHCALRVERSADVFRNRKIIMNMFTVCSHVTNINSRMLWVQSPGSYPWYLGLVKWCLWWTKWRGGRLSPNTSVSPANLHSTKFSILTITRGRYNKPKVVDVPSGPSMDSSSHYTNWKN
jgi:hypothetical protein